MFAETYTVNLYVGHNVEGKPQHTTEHIYKTACSVLNIQGATILKASGIWENQEEETTILIIAGLDATEGKRIIDGVPILSKHLQQECILTTVQKNLSSFISPEKDFYKAA